MTSLKLQKFGINCFNITGPQGLPFCFDSDGHIMSHGTALCLELLPFVVHVVYAYMSPPSTERALYPSSDKLFSMATISPQNKKNVMLLDTLW